MKASAKWNLMTPFRVQYECQGFRILGWHHRSCMMFFTSGHRGHIILRIVLTHCFKSREWSSKSSWNVSFSKPFLTKVGLLFSQFLSSVTQVKTRWCERVNILHHGSEHPRSDIDGALLPDGPWDRHLGFFQVQEGTEEKWSQWDGDDVTGKPEHQLGGGDLHHDRWGQLSWRQQDGNCLSQAWRQKDLAIYKSSTFTRKHRELLFSMNDKRPNQIWLTTVLVGWCPTGPIDQ